MIHPVNNANRGANNAVTICLVLSAFALSGSSFLRMSYSLLPLMKITFLTNRTPSSYMVVSAGNPTGTMNHPHNIEITHA